MRRKFIFAFSFCLLLALSTSVANAFETIIREAESADSITAPFQILDDALASGGKYISNPTEAGQSNTNPPTTGIAKYNITLTEGGTYKMLLRVICTVGGENDDSCYVKITGATPSITPGGNDGWTNCNNIDGTMAAADTQVWFWAQVREYGTTYPGNVITFDIPAGSTTIQIAYREDGLKIDTIILTNDPSASTTNLPLPISSNPSPAINAKDVVTNVKFSWKPGVFAETHNVFLGTDINDVTDATVSDHANVNLFEALDVNTLAPGKLAYGTDYYWRVDDVTASKTETGSIWKFSTEPVGHALTFSNIVDVNAYSPYGIIFEGQEPNDTCSGSGLDANDMHSTNNTTMWLGMADNPGEIWIQYEFDQIYKFYQLEVWNYNEEAPGPDYGAKDVNITYSTDNETWKSLGDIVEIQKATGLNNYKANTFVDMNNAIAKYIRITFLSSWSDEYITGGLSEVRFLVIPTRASKPSPANNATNAALDSILSWEPGRDAAVHKIYIASDKDSLTAEAADIKATTVEPNYVPDLKLSQKYYWKVDEVNDAVSYPVWDGPVWSFSTQDNIIIDNFESGYGNTEANAVYKTWKDGVELKNKTENGSYMGRPSPPYLQTINHSGGHSAPMQYDTLTHPYSEVIANSESLPIKTTDWSAGSPSTLTIWFRGDPNTTTVGDSELYCKLGGMTATFSGSLDILKKDLWIQWDIDLAGLGVNLNNIPSITIGIKKIGTVGGGGVIYLDDIMLTGKAPVTAAPDLYIEAENYTTITAPMEVNDALPGAFGGQYVGVPDGKSNSTTEPNYPEGTITYNVTVTGGVYKVMARFYIEGTEYGGDSCWVQIPTATAVKTADGNDVTLTPEGSTIANGWVNSNNLVGGTSWMWDTLLSSLNGDQDALWTLPAGTHTLKISNREDGLYFDALLIVKVSD